MRRSVFALVASLPFVMGAKGGCGPITSTDPAPSVTGQWAIRYGGTMDVEVRVGAAVYRQSLPGTGGAFTVTDAGLPLSFNIDCSRADVVCPSEVWPSKVSIDQRDATYPHRMWVSIPTQSCDGRLVAPAPSECGQGTLNPDCKPVCSGAVTTTAADAFGLIAENGSSFDLLLGASVASNGINCVLLGASVAHADLVSSGSAANEDWIAQTMQNGAIKTSYAGGCLWAGDPTMPGVVATASVEITTSFDGDRI